MSSRRGGRQDRALARPGTRPRRATWLLATVSLTVVGASVAMLGATAVARNDGDRSRRAFAASSQDVAAELQLAIQHEDDLIFSAATVFFGSNPPVSRAGFARWADLVRVLQRYPEVQTLSDVVMVPAAQLPAFLARADAEAPPHSAPLTVFPPGRRRYYCLSTVSVVRAGAVAVPAGYDACASKIGGAALAVRDSGVNEYLPFNLGRTEALAIGTPIYRNGTTPTAVAERRAAFVGWCGTVIVPEVLLNQALRGHPHTAVAFRYGSGASSAVYRSGEMPADAQSVSLKLANGWTVQTFGIVPPDDLVEGRGAALGLLVAGVITSLLLGALVYALGTSRTRALALVEDKTDELRHQAMHDALTGLPNRALIMDRIEQMLARSRRNGTIGSVLYVDLDEFKNINDSLGHAAGDQLLQAVAARLTHALRDADTIGRMGGDEFVVLIDGGTLDVEAELVAERLLEVMRQPFELDASPTSIMVTTSVGIAVGNRETPGDMLRDADMALYQAKAAGKNCAVVFHDQMQTDVRHRYELEFDLRGALDDHQFVLVYQPIYDLGDLTILGVEALLRWQHPTLGMVQPDEFIPLLEASGHIVEVGRWVLVEACRQMAHWRDMGSDLTIAVNVSGRQLDRDTIVDHVRGALESSGLDPAVLTLEVTETALMKNVDNTARRLRDLKALGVQVAIDDFGTGYSSLAYLQRFPVDCLKIDRSFIEAMSESPESRSLVHTLVQLGVDLGLKTLAEGVETDDQVDGLRTERVDQAQGFLLAPPLDAHTLETTILKLTPAPGASKR